ncbi:MAG: squalene cyclase [Acidimicrobiales bacterium]
MASDPVLAWLLDADPAIRWQVARDLLGASEPEWAAERARVATQGWGARLLSLRDADGQWAGGSFVPRGFTAAEWEREGQPWTASTYALTQLREFGIDPATPRMRETIALLRDHCRWDHADEPFWDGEVEECINGRTVADGAYFGVDVEPIVRRPLAGRQADGGWNCERANGSTRSSFASTINVLEGLLTFETATGGNDAVRSARRAGEEFLLERDLFVRRSTGTCADDAFLRFVHPSWWRYSVLRALDYFRAAGLATNTAPDSRLTRAIAIVESRRLPDGRWPLDERPAGRTWFEIDDSAAAPSRWITLQARRVLQWWRGSHAGFAEPG